MKPAAVPDLTLRPIHGSWFRALRLKYWETRLSTEHSRTATSRFSAATVSSPSYPIMYLGEHHQVTLYEVGALLGSPGDPVSNPKGSWVILNLRVVLDGVADLTDEGQQRLLETTHQELTGLWADGDAPTQALGAALHAAPGVEGFLFPSSKPPGTNLAVFPGKLGPRRAVVFFNEVDGREERLT